MQGGTFVASEILAKHDERYMPKEVADALKAEGHFHGEEAAAKPEADAGPAVFLACGESPACGRVRAGRSVFFLPKPF